MSNDNDKADLGNESLAGSLVENIGNSTTIRREGGDATDDYSAAAVSDRELAAKVVIAADAATCNHEAMDEILITECENQDIPGENRTRNEAPPTQSSNQQQDTQRLPFIPRAPQPVYPGAEAVKGPDYNEDDDNDDGTIVYGEDISAPIMAQVVDVDTEEDLRQQIRSLQERLQQLPTTAEVIATGTPMPVVEGTPIIAASAQRQNVKTILWVDDNPRFSTDEANFLTERGFHITNCTSTNEARKLLQEEEFDVIISDVHRVEDGQEHHDAGYQLLESPEVQESDVPFIFYLSNVSYLDQNRSETALGATDNDYGLLNLVMRAVY
jgi:CheY-like chemotaxis protein